METSSTPQWVKDYVIETFPPVTFNPCEAENFNGLIGDWPTAEGELSFVNPPFAEAQLWIEKAARELKKGARSILFVPANFNSLYFRESVYPCALEIRVFTAPIKMPGKNKQLPCQTALVIYVARDDVTDDSPPPVFVVNPPNWEKNYYKRPRNQSRFASGARMN